MNLAYKEVIINQIQLLFPRMPFYRCNRDAWEKKYQQYRDCIRVIENLDSVKAVPVEKIRDARDKIYTLVETEPFTSKTQIEIEFNTKVLAILDELIESEE